MIKQNRLLEDALRAFRDTTGLAATCAAQEIRLPQGIADAEIRLAQGPPLLAEIKPNLRRGTLGAALARLTRFDKPGILVTDYITQPMAEELVAKGVPFMDAAGNAYLNTPQQFILVTGRKRPENIGLERPVKAFRAAGLRVIFVLLTAQRMLELPTRQIAYHAGVANGTVGNVLKDLERMGFIYRSKARGLVIEQRERLIEQWVDAYPRELRPRLKPQRFHILNADWWRQFTYDRYEKHQMWLGGEPAAQALTRYLHAEQCTVYGRPDFRKLATVLEQPMRDKHGNFELLEPFWNLEFDEYDEVHRLCPPLLIYADLVATGNTRNIEAANMIRNQYLRE